MAKQLDRDDELPEILYKLTPDEEARISRSLGKTAKDLGRLETVLAGPMNWGNSPRVTLGTALLMLIGVVAIPIAMQRLDPKQPNYDSEHLAGSIAWYVFTAAFALFGGYTAFLLTRPWWKRGEHWFFFRDGVVRTNFGGWPLVLRWDDMKSYKAGAGLGGDRYEFHGPRGKPAKLHIHALGSRALPEAILDRQIVALGPGMLRRIDAGEAVKFGPFALTRQGLAYKDKFKDKKIPWEDVDRFEVDSTGDTKFKPELVVRAGKADWVSADLSGKVPNAWLMLWLVRKLRPKLIRDFDKLRRVLS